MYFTLQVKISNFCITFQATENLAVYVIGGNVVWKLFLEDSNCVKHGVPGPLRFNEDLNCI